MNTQRHWLGFGLSLFTAVLWGILPLFLQLCLQAMDSPTITFYRFVFASLFVFFVLLFRRGLPKLRHQPKAIFALLLMTTLALVVNYVFNVIGLQFISAENVQVLMQIAPFMLMLGGVFFYAEPMRKREWSGAAMLFTGLLLFFNDSLTVLFSGLNDYSWGNLMIVIAATSWASYALLQKRLLRSFTAKQLTLLIYLLGGFMLLPFSQIADIGQLNALQAGALLFCCANTVLAYGAFTEAMAVWHAAKVSAVIAMSPIFTFVSMEIAVWVWPMHFQVRDIDTLAYLGAGLVVGGSMLSALSKAKATSSAKPA